MKKFLPLLLWLFLSGVSFAQGLGGPTIGGGVPCYQHGDCILNSVNGSGKISASSVTANASFGTIPANAYLLQAFFHETAGNNVSVAIGTTLGGSDVMAATAVVANGTLTYIPAQTPNWFSATKSQALFLTFSNGSGYSINAELDWKTGP